MPNFHLILFIQSPSPKFFSLIDFFLIPSAHVLLGLPLFVLSVGVHFRNIIKDEYRNNEEKEQSGSQLADPAWTTFSKANYRKENSYQYIYASHVYRPSEGIR